MNGGQLGAIFFADCWDIQWRRRQQIAYRLAQNHLIEHVIYVEKPLTITSLLKFLMGKADLDGTDRWRRVFANRSWLMPVNNKLSVLTTFTPLPIVGFAPFFEASERVRHLWLTDKLNSLCQRFALGRLLVWVSFPQVPLHTIQHIQPEILWYDCTEDFSAFPYPDCTRAQVLKTDRYLSESANVVSTVSRVLFEEKRQVNPHTYWLPNAVDTDVFLKREDSLAVPGELRGVRRPILAFVGGMCEWAHDWDLLDAVATMRPGWTILLIGHLEVSTSTRQMLQRHPGILCLGQQPYEKLPNYLAHSDICFIFYRPIRKNNSGNSQKLFLYLACGKPVVSTSSADVYSYRDYVYIANTPEAFVTAMEKALSEHTPAKARTYQEMVQSNSWKARIEEITKILTKMMDGDKG